MPSGLRDRKRRQTSRRASAPAWKTSLRKRASGRAGTAISGASTIPIFTLRPNSMRPRPSGTVCVYDVCIRRTQPGILGPARRFSPLARSPLSSGRNTAGDGKTRLRRRCAGPVSSRGREPSGRGEYLQRPFMQAPQHFLGPVTVTAVMGRFPSPRGKLPCTSIGLADQYWAPHETVSGIRSAGRYNKANRERRV
jgi:hypothetical protein